MSSRVGVPVCVSPGLDDLHSFAQHPFDEAEAVHFSVVVLEQERMMLVPQVIHHEWALLEPNLDVARSTFSSNLQSLRRRPETWRKDCRSCGSPERRSRRGLSCVDEESRLSKDSGDDGNAPPALCSCEHAATVTTPASVTSTLFLTLPFSSLSTLSHWTEGRARSRCGLR